MENKKTISEIEREYNLELNKIIKNIKKEKSERILLQFPDGLKNISSVIKDYLQEKTGKQFFIYLGSCFGACDLPNVREKDFDLIIQFGHSSWDYDKNSGIKVLK